MKKQCLRIVFSYMSEPKRYFLDSQRDRIGSGHEYCGIFTNMTKRNLFLILILSAIATISITLYVSSKRSTPVLETDVVLPVSTTDTSQESVAIEMADPIGQEQNDATIVAPTSNNDQEETPSYIQDEDGVRFEFNPNEAPRIVPSNPETFEILKGKLKPLKDYLRYLYARDDTHVFYAGEILPEANVQNFHPIENGYGIHIYGTDGSRVYIGSQIISGADPMTFRPLWETIYEGCGSSTYSKDVSHVYYHKRTEHSGFNEYTTTVVSDADPATFESLINEIGKDKHGYYESGVYIGPTIDPVKLNCDYG